MFHEYSDFFPYWEHLTIKQRQVIADNMVFRRYAPGDHVVIHRPRKDGLVFVLEGVMRVYIASANGREMTLSSVEPGNVFCIMTVDRAMEHDVVPRLQATAPSVAAYIPRSVIEPIALQIPQLASFIFDAAAEEAQAIINSSAFYFFNTLRGCVAKLIVERTPPETDTLKITHEEIANSLGTTRVVISRELEILSKMGLLETHRGRIRITDRAGLESFSVGE